MSSQRPDDPQEPGNGSRWLTQLNTELQPYQEQAASLIQRAYDIGYRATDGLLPYLINAWTDFAQRDTRYAASLAYYALFSIFPIILLAVTFISRLIGPTLAQEQVLRFLDTFIPSEVIAPIEETIILAIDQSSSFSIIAIVGLSWAALSLFANLTIALDNIFEPTRWRPLWHKRLLASAMMLGLGIMLFVSLLTTVTLRLISLFLLDQSSTALTIISLFLPLGLNMMMFALLFRNVPRDHIRWDAIWPAAVLGGAGWQIAQNLFVWYLERFNNFSVIYGSIGTVMILLLWVYISAAILLIAAELCAAINDWIEDRRRDEEQHPRHLP